VANITFHLEVVFQANIQGAPGNTSETVYLKSPVQFEISDLKETSAYSEICSRSLSILKIVTRVNNKTGQRICGRNEFLKNHTNNDVKNNSALLIEDPDHFSAYRNIKGIESYEAALKANKVKNVKTAKGNLQGEADRIRNHFNNYIICEENVYTTKDRQPFYNVNLLERHVKPLKKAAETTE